MMFISQHLFPSFFRGFKFHKERAEEHRVVRGMCCWDFSFNTITLGKVSKHLLYQIIFLCFLSDCWSDYFLLRCYVEPAKLINIQMFTKYNPLIYKYSSNKIILITRIRGTILSDVQHSVSLQAKLL